MGADLVDRLDHHLTARRTRPAARALRMTPDFYLRQPVIDLDDETLFLFHLLSSRLSIYTYSIRLLTKISCFLSIVKIIF